MAKRKIIKNDTDDVVLENKPYKTCNCKVLSYDNTTKDLDVDFKGYGIRLHNVENVQSDFVDVKYLGEIGSPNFSYSL